MPSWNPSRSSLPRPTAAIIFPRRLTSAASRRQARRAVDGGRDALSVGAIEFLPDRAQLALLELADRETAPPVGRANDRGEHQLQHRALAEGIRDDFRATSFLEEEPFEEICTGCIDCRRRQTRVPEASDLSRSPRLGAQASPRKPPGESVECALGKAGGSRTEGLDRRWRALNPGAGRVPECRAASNQKTICLGLDVIPLPPHRVLP